MQVSAFGGDDQSDYGDVWQVEWTQAGSAWQRDQKVRYLQLPHAWLERHKFMSICMMLSSCLVLNTCNALRPRMLYNTN